MTIWQLKQKQREIIKEATACEKYYLLFPTPQNKKVDGKAALAMARMYGEFIKQLELEYDDNGK